MTSSGIRCGDDRRDLPGPTPPGIRPAVESLVAQLAGTGPESGPVQRRLPVALDEVVDRLEASAWPEVAGSWSRLTPSGFPVEVTVLPDRTWHWAAEVAGPEFPDSARLERALELLGTPVPAATRQALLAHQAGRDLRFGAWIAGRCELSKVHATEPPATELSASKPPATKVYAELPAGRHLPVPLPERVASALARLPSGTTPRLLGVEPSRERTELYLRLPATELGDLRPFLHATGHTEAPRALDEALPDGVRRLSGRRLAVSLAWTADGPLELAMFVTARTLFPGHPQGLLTLAPYLTGLSARPCLVTLAIGPAGRTVSTRVSICPRPE